MRAAAPRFLQALERNVGVWIGLGEEVFHVGSTSAELTAAIAGNALPESFKVLR